MALSGSLPQINLGVQVTSRLYQQFQTTGTVIRTLEQSRPKATTLMEDQYLTINARHHKDMTDKELAQERQFLDKLFTDRCEDEPPVRLFRGAIGQVFIFMDDNTRSHTANIVEDFLEEEDICRMDWPA
ncbi:hypothetical protein TNCV_3377051 [Trichonephila clavipes]|nr:hypothetical protein TNCV_3377051 [Trichonephila clavipes]